ncbi:MAG: hypothetical protein ACYDHH_16180 [Solirubrobacteraceae bacterium]
MPDDSIRQHIETVAARASRETSRLTEQLVGSCWPGGSDDRTEPAARGWVARWRPAVSGAPTPVCACAGGSCTVCN